MKSLAEQKLVVTLPWIVQFLGMLDAVTLHSEYYRSVFELLYELYIMSAETTTQRNATLSLRPTSLFIIRSCLGWLFDQPNVPNNYYDYRRNRRAVSMPSLAINSELTSVEVFVPKSLVHHFNDSPRLILRNVTEAHQALVCTLERNSGESLALTTRTIETNTTFEPLLENILVSACPFLADFRVSMMPKRNAKELSRTGRYRHITTKLFDSSPIATTVDVNVKRNKIEDAQTKLIDAFLHSQTLSVRRTVEFVHERVFSAIVKDFQVEILIPYKKNISANVDRIQSVQRQEIYEKLCQIYVDAEKELLQKWKEFVTHAAEQRVKVKFN